MSILNNSTLSKLPSGVQVPKYNRDEIKVGIFHFGVGGFHRAHQAKLIDDLLNNGQAKDFGICGVNILPFDQKMRDVMVSQNNLYTLVEKPNDGNFSYRIIGSIVDYIFAPDNVDLLIERLTGDEAKIITLTITEGGYNINPSNGEFNLANPTIQNDIKNLSQPMTVFGIICEALRRRKERNLRGFSILSCDNLQGNGKIAKKSFLTFANAVDPSLYEWMLKNVTFPNSMVDRITPVTTDDDRKRTSEKLGLIDGWPVVCEDFFQWVVEDNFVAGSPFELGGVQIVPDVEPYEFMKLRLINAGHQLIAYFGLLIDYVFVHDAMSNELISSFLKSYLDNEATSTLQPVAGINVEEYKAKIIQRFKNPNVKDTLARLAVDGSDRIFKFVIPVIVDRLKNNESVYLSTAIVASFSYYINGVSEKGNKINVVDAAKDKLTALSKKLQNDSTAIKHEHEMFGDVVRDARFIKTFKEIYEKIKNEGSEKTLKWLATL